jgi:hypothetical protein
MYIYKFNRKWAADSRERNWRKKEEKEKRPADIGEINQKEKPQKPKTKKKQTYLAW